MTAALSFLVRGVPAGMQPTPEPGLHNVTVQLSRNLLVGSDMQSRLEDSAQESVDVFFLDIQESKDYLDKNYPGAREKYSYWH